MNDKNIIYSVMEGGYISCHTNGKIYKNYDEFKKEMLCYYGKEELINKINNLQSKIDKISEYVDKIYDVMDYKDYPPYLDEIYYTLHPELKEDK